MLRKRFNSRKWVKTNANLNECFKPVLCLMQISLNLREDATILSGDGVKEQP